MSPTGFSAHNHRACIASGLAAADELCATKGVRLTPVRRRVLEILLTEHKAIGAYDILDHLAKDGASAKPPTAYRALDFLTTHGLAHKIERLNAYIACTSPETRHDPAFLICTGCDHVAETSAPRAIEHVAREAGFDIDTTIIEATGLCPTCRELA